MKALTLIYNHMKFGFGNLFNNPPKEDKKVEDEANKEAVFARLDAMAEENKNRDSQEKVFQPQKPKVEMTDEITPDMTEEMGNPGHKMHPQDQKKFDDLYRKYASKEEKMNLKEIMDEESRDPDFKDYKDMKMMGAEPSRLSL
jgi:hypothetical protein